MVEILETAGGDVSGDDVSGGVDAPRVTNDRTIPTCIQEDAAPVIPYDIVENARIASPLEMDTYETAVHEVVLDPEPGDTLICRSVVPPNACLAAEKFVVRHKRVVVPLSQYSGNGNSEKPAVDDRGNGPIGYVWVATDVQADAWVFELDVVDGHLRVGRNVCLLVRDRQELDEAVSYQNVLALVDSRSHAKPTGVILDQVVDVQVFDQCARGEIDTDTNTVVFDGPILDCHSREILGSDADAARITLDRVSAEIQEDV